MGGKNKQSQRTKNNVRPSSSGRSAELLNSAGIFDPAMTTGKLMPALFPTMAAVTLDAGLDPELAMCVKKLNKKDPITKTKALQELTELVNKSSADDVEAVLPSWSHFYKILSVDGDCKVRECAQVCHGSIVLVCGRRVAPHLRALLPAWLAAQHDDHAPAMAQAQRTLQNTFPEAKLPEVISFCKTEILDYLEDNLTGKSALSAAASEGEGGRSSAAALHGLAWTCKHAPQALDDWLWARVAKLLNTDAFWRLAAHKEAGVRAAWFSALGRVVERFKSSIDAKTGTRLLRTVLAAKENDVRAHARLWDCLLLFMHTLPEWQNWLDKKDLLAKRILNLLETGGWGDAKQLSQTLLPLLAALPPDMLTQRFYETFFDAIFKGLEKKSIVNSKLERQAWLTGLSECIRFVSLQSLPSAVVLVTAAHRRWLQAALDDPALLKHSATCMTELLKFWMRKTSSEDGDKFSILVRNFWQNIGATFHSGTQLTSEGSTQLTSEGGTQLTSELAAAGAQRHEMLLSAVRASPRQKHTIRFDGDSPPAAAPPPASSPHDSELFRHHLATATEQVCSRYIQIAIDLKSPNNILPALSPLLNSLSKSSLEAVARLLEVGSVYGMFEKVLLPWLEDDHTRCEAVMDLAFLLLEHMTEEEQDAMYAAFKEEPVTTWCLPRALSHAAVRRAASRRWLRGAAVSRALRAAACGLTARDTRLLLAALTPDDRDEMLVNPETVTSVVDILVTSLSADQSERLVRVASQLATSLSQRPPDNYAALLLALFDVNLSTQRGSGSLSLESWLEARSAWQDGLTAVTADRQSRLTADATALLLTHALPAPDDTLEDVKISTIEHATSLCPYLLTECEQNVPTNTDQIAQLIAQLFSQLVAQQSTRSNASLDVFALRHDVIVGKLSCPFGDNDAMETVVRDCDKEELDELERDVLVLRLTEILFRTLCLRTLFLHRPDTEDSNEDKEQTWCSVLLSDERIQAEFCRLLRDYVVVHSLHEGYAFWPHYEIIERVKHKLDSSLQDIISETPISIRREILMSLSTHAAKEGYYWAYARAWFEAHAANQTDKTGDESEDQSADLFDLSNVDVANLAEVVTGNGLYHSLQANVRFLSPPPPPTDVQPPSCPALRSAHLVMLRAALASLEAENAPKDVREQFAKDAVLAAQGDATPDVIVDLYYKFENVMVGDREPSSVPWATAACSAAAWRYLSLLTAERGRSGAAHHWDFTTISLCAAVQGLTHRHTTKTAMLCVSALNLLRSVSTFITDLPAECEKRQPLPHVAALMDEWRDIFSPDIQTNLFNVILRVLDSPPPGPITCHIARTLSSLTTSTSCLQWSSLPHALRVDSLSLERVSSACSLALCAATHRGYKYLAHATLAAIAGDLLLEDADKLRQWSDAAEGSLPPLTLSVSYFHQHYLTLLELLDAALSAVQVGEATCEMTCGSDARGVALGALLLCDVIHRVCERARGDLTHHYINLFRVEKYTDLVLSGAVRLLPTDVFSWAVDTRVSTALPERYVDLFVTPRLFSLDESESSCSSGAGDVGALACRSVLHALSGPGQPAARAAWAAWPPRAASALSRLTAAAVAPCILREQFRRAAKRASTLVDTELILLPQAREAQAVHTVEEQPLRLTITFSPSHPLTPPRVQSPPAGPAAASPWLSMYLGYQRGSLLDAVSLWVTSVSARVERAPQCYICYCRLQPGEGLLPKVHCNQCRNKFHNACLRKWFTTSKKSNCPVCRAMF